MQTGFLLPTTIVYNGKVTGNEWSNPDNFFLVDGDVSTSNVGQGVASDITVGGFDISLPMDAVVDGIEIKVIGYQGSQTVPELTLTINAYNNVDGADIYYPYTSPFTGLTPTLAEYVLGSPTYLFGTTWTVDKINNFKFNLVANGDISLDSILVNVHYHITTPPTPPTPTPGVCIDCSSPIQVQAMYLELPFLSNQTKFYLKKGSFVYPNGVPVQPGDIGSCGGIIPFVFDEGVPKVAGSNFEENAQLDTNTGTWTVLDNGVIEVDISDVTNRGLDYKTPGTHVATNMSDHDANSKVIISNNETWNLQLVRRCQEGTVFSAPIAVWQDGNFGTPITSYMKILNVITPLLAVNPSGNQIDLSLDVVALANDETFINALVANSTFISDLVTQINASGTISVVTDGTLSGDGTTGSPLHVVSSTGLVLETDGTTNGDQALLNLISGTNITIVDDGVGGITINSTGGGSSISLETNGTLNGDQTLLNLKNGTNVTIVDDGIGGITINASLGSALNFTVNADENQTGYHTSQIILQTATSGATITAYGNGIHIVDTSGGAGATSVKPILALLANGAMKFDQPKTVRLKVPANLGTASGGTNPGSGFGLGDSSSAAPTFVNEDDTTFNSIKFVINSGVVYAVTSDGVGRTKTVISAGSLYEIVWKPTSGVEFFVDGALVATHATNVPASPLVAVNFIAASYQPTFSGVNGVSVDYPTLSIEL